MSDFSRSAKRSHIRVLTECAILISLSTVLSILRIAELPYGGSITLASMLPLVILAYRNGTGWGLGAGLVYGVIQQLLGLKNLSYFTTFQSVIAIILLDYLVAFTVIGLAGLFRHRMKRQNAALVTGGALACLLRYFCHVISGATVWVGLSIPTGAALGYSLLYNATYMIPETIVLLVAAAYLGSILDFRRELPVRMKQERLVGPGGWFYIGAGFSLLVLLIFDTAAVFPHLQDGDSGLFSLSGLSAAPVTAILVVSAVCLATAMVLFLLGKRKAKNSAPAIDK